MNKGARLPRRVVVVEAPFSCPPASDLEVQRFLQPQPPLVVPSRTFEDRRAGLVAYQLLGHRVYPPGT